MSTEVWLGPGETASASPKSSTNIRRMLLTDTLAGARCKSPAEPGLPCATQTLLRCRYPLGDDPDSPKSGVRITEASFAAEHARRHGATSNPTTAPTDRATVVNQRVASEFNVLNRAGVLRLTHAGALNVYNEGLNAWPSTNPNQEVTP
jgi:hypothetical protein